MTKGLAKKDEFLVPAYVPEKGRKEYVENYNAVIHGCGRLTLFAGDQKIEHLNDDFSEMVFQLRTEI